MYNIKLLTMDRIKKYHRELCTVCRFSTAKSRRVAFKNRELVKAIIDIVHNVLNGNIKVKNKAKLSKYKHNLRYINKRSNTIAAKQKYLVQKGGFLPFLAPLIPLLVKAATVAAPLIAKGAVLGAAGTGAGAIVSKIIEKARQ